MIAHLRVTYVLGQCVTHVLGSYRGLAYDLYVYIGDDAGERTGQVSVGTTFIDFTLSPSTAHLLKQLAVTLQVTTWSSPASLVPHKPSPMVVTTMLTAQVFEALSSSQFQSHPPQPFSASVASP